MKKILFICVLFLSELNLSAQTTSQSEDPKLIEMRQKIGIDYSVPDYDAKKPDAKVMGWRLAKILQSLKKNYYQGVYNQLLMAVRAEQIKDENVRYVPIDKIKILKISKKGDDITILIKTTSKSEIVGKVDFTLNLLFKKGVSESNVTNS